MEQNNLDICVSTWFGVNDEISLPLFIDIKDISFKTPIILNNKIEIYKNSLKIDKTNQNPYQENYNIYNLKKAILYYLRFIDNRKMFCNCTKTFIQNEYNCETIEEFYYELMKLGFTQTHFTMLKNEIDYYIGIIKNTFIKNTIKILDYERNFPVFNISDSFPEKYKEFITYTNEMTKYQSGIEYSNVIIFPENLGKSLSEYSWRELEFKSLYISMKNKIEGFINSYQSWKMEQSTKDTKR